MQNYCSFIKRKTNFISLQVDFLIQLVYVPFKTVWSCGEFSKKRLLVDLKAKYLFWDIGLLEVETDLITLADVARVRLGDDFDLLGVSLEAILRFRSLRMSVCGAHGCSAPPPSSSSPAKVSNSPVVQLG